MMVLQSLQVERLLRLLLIHERKKIMKTNTIPQSKVEISASIMCIDWLHAGKQLKIIEEQSIDYLHWDIIDGRFAPDFTMGSSIINKFRENY